MAPEERLGSQEGRRTERSDLGKPASGKRVKGPQTSQKGEKVEQVAQVRDAPGQDELQGARQGRPA